MFNLNLSFMNNSLIDESAEKTSLSIMNVFYCVNLILCVLAFIAALIAIFNESFGIGVCIIIPTIIYLLFVVLFDALCKTFVNISLKLDKENAILEELKRLNNYLKKEERKVSKKDNSDEIEAVIKEMTEQENIKETNIPQKQHKFDYEFEKEVYEKIVEGKDMEARILLIQKKELSVPAAIAYIQTIKDSLQ